MENGELKMESGRWKVQSNTGVCLEEEVGTNPVPKFSITYFQETLPLYLRECPSTSMPPLSGGM